MKWLGVKEVATQLGLSANTVGRLIRERHLRAANLGVAQKPQYKVRQEDLDAFIASRTTGPDDDSPADIDPRDLAMLKAEGVM